MATAVIPWVVPTTASRRPSLLWSATLLAPALWLQLAARGVRRRNGTSQRPSLRKRPPSVWLRLRVLSRWRPRRAGFRPAPLLQPGEGAAADGGVLDVRYA